MARNSWSEGMKGKGKVGRGEIQSTMNTMISQETVFYTVLVAFSLFHLGLGICIQGDPILIISDIARGREEEKRDTNDHYNP